MSTLIKYFAMDVMRMTRPARWNLYTLAENYPEYMDRYSITMEDLRWQYHGMHLQSEMKI